MTITLCILLSIIGGLLLYLFFAPFYLEVNSNTGLFQIRLHRAASFGVKIEDRLYIETCVFGLKKRSAFTLYNQRTGKKQTATRPLKPHQQKVRRMSSTKLLAVIKSFKLNRCHISVDTGEMEWNGMLYPVAYCLAWYYRKPIEINFVGNNEIVLEIQNSIARMSWAFISSKV